MLSLGLDSAALAETHARVSDRQFSHGKLVLTDIGLRPGQSLPGAGTGRLTAHAAKLVGPTGRVTAVDPLPVRIETAKKMRQPNLKASIAQAEDRHRFPDASFDVVFLNSVFHRSYEKLGPLRRGAACVEKGGRLGITTAAKERPRDIELVRCSAFASPAPRAGGPGTRPNFYGRPCGRLSHTAVE